MDKKTSVDSLVLKPKVAFLLWRERRSLTTGLRRLRRWKSLLLETLKAVRPQLKEPNPLLQLPGLPKMQVPTGQLQWAVEMMEDLYLLLETLEVQLSKMSPKS